MSLQNHTLYAPAGASEYVGLIGRPDPGPSGGWSSASAKSPGATVSRGDLGASENVFQIAAIVLESAGPRMGGRAVSVRWFFGTGQTRDRLSDVSDAQHWGETSSNQPAEIDVLASSEVVDPQEVVVRRSFLALRSEAEEF